jgi:hypothetical protein
MWIVKPAEQDFYTVNATLKDAYRITASAETLMNKGSQPFYKNAVITPPLPFFLFRVPGNANHGRKNFLKKNPPQRFGKMFSSVSASAYYPHRLFGTCLTLSKFPL